VPLNLPLKAVYTPRRSISMQSQCIRDPENATNLYSRTLIKALTMESGTISTNIQNIPPAHRLAVRRMAWALSQRHLVSPCNSTEFSEIQHANSPSADSSTHESLHSHRKDRHHSDTSGSRAQYFHALSAERKLDGPSATPQTRMKRSSFTCAVVITGLGARMTA
jgi:hypothetical protein